MYPWTLNIVREQGDGLRIHPGYGPKSALGKERAGAFLKKCTQAYDEFKAAGNQMQAMLCLPLGTEVQIKGQGGLRDVVYMLELRGHAHGANFEYKAQALAAIEGIKNGLSPEILELIGWPKDPK